MTIIASTLHIRTLALLNLLLVVFFIAQSYLLFECRMTPTEIIDSIGL